MRSSRRASTILAVGAAIGLVQATAGAAEGKPDNKQPPKKEKKPKASKAKPEEQDELNIPVPKGEAQKSVKFPIYGADGTLDMRFEIGVATRVDEENVKMQKLRIETFKPDEKDPAKRTRDMDMDLPDAVLNQKSKDITSNTAVTIKRDSFEITGNTMKFNLQTRQGTLGGGVRMVIYDMDKIGTEGKPAVEFQKPNEEIKK